VKSGFEAIQAKLEMFRELEWKMTVDAVDNGKGDMMMDSC
jgi:hypothetical protein